MLLMRLTYNGLTSVKGGRRRWSGGMTNRSRFEPSAAPLARRASLKELGGGNVKSLLAVNLVKSESLLASPRSKSS